MILSEVAILNDIAVGLMRNEHYEHAAPLLSQGMHKMITYRICEYRPCTNFASNPTSLWTDLSLPQGWRCSRILRRIPLPGRPILQGYLLGNPFNFYSVGFSIQVPTSWHCYAMELFDSLLASVLSYNLAVLHHQAALVTGNSDQLLSALELYLVATRTLHPYAHLMMNGGVHSVDLRSLLTMATANMMHIHAHFLDLQQAAECLDLVVGLMMKNSDPDQDEVSKALCQDVKFFLVFRKSLFAHAPAA